MKKLNLKGCKTNAAVSKLVTERVALLSYQELLAEISKDFVFQEEATRAVYLGLSSNMNVFLSGPSGFGKSSLVKRILEIYQIPYSTVVGYKDMSVDALLGVPDMDKLIKESEYVINFNKSIFSEPGILIGEEFTDILPKTASVLKDILSEKGYRHKLGKDESLIASMIVLANKSPIEITEDESTKALYIERFPIKADVRWPTYEIADYLALFKCVLPNKSPELTYFIASIFANNHITHQNTVSPRIAVEAAKVFFNKGLEFLKPMDIDLSEVEHIKQVASRDYAMKALSGGLKNLVEYVENEENILMKQDKCVYALLSLRQYSLTTNLAVEVSNTIVTITGIYKTLLLLDKHSYVKDIDKMLGLLWV